MKRSILSLCLFLCVSAYGQQSPKTHTYDLRIEDVTNRSEAKMVTDILRSYINPADNPFAYYPTFNDERDNFVFDSEREITEDEIRTYLKEKHDLTLIYCKKVK